MKTHAITVGDTQIENNVFLAPMAGYTDYAYRKLQLKLGTGLAFTELVSAKGLIYGSQGTAILLYSKGDENKTAVQLFGADPFYMRSACESPLLEQFKIVDINMGCPVPKVFKNGEGSALLTNIYKAEKIIKECVKSKKNITVKIRTGIKKGDNIATEYAKMAENAGAKLITIHGRVRDDYYSGEVNYSAIESAKNAVKIPVIANGGVFTEEDANLLMERTGADGVMLARGAIVNPFLSAKLLGRKVETTLKQYILEQLSLMQEIYQDKRTSLEFRKFTAYYFKGIPNVKEIKLAINSAQNLDQLRQIIIERL